MSLINDALKRAQEAQRPDTRSSVSSLRTIDTRPKARPFLSRLLVVVIFLLLAAAFVFIGLAMTGRLVKKNIAMPQISAPAPPVAAAVTPARQVTAPMPVVTAAPVVPDQPAPVPAPVPVAVAVVAVPPPPPYVFPDTLHVQGVAYDPVRPWAIVSGKTVYVGEMVKGVRVLAISRNSVTFGSHGQTNLLYVGQ
jgi:hypothetical protein